MTRLLLPTVRNLGYRGRASEIQVGDFTSDVDQHGPIVGLADLSCRDQQT
jgi:hypothetical protein